MLNVSRVFTSASENSEIAIIIEVPNGNSAAILWNSFKLMTDNDAQVLLRNHTGIDEIWVHKNRDNSVAVAIGASPLYWYEDSPEPIGD